MYPRIPGLAFIARIIRRRPDRHLAAMQPIQPRQDLRDVLRLPADASAPPERSLVAPNLRAAAELVADRPKSRRHKLAQIRQRDDQTVEGRAFLNPRIQGANPPPLLPPLRPIGGTQKDTEGSNRLPTPVQGPIDKDDAAAAAAAAAAGNVILDREFNFHDYEGFL